MSPFICFYYISVDGTVGPDPRKMIWVNLRFYAGNCDLENPLWDFTESICSQNLLGVISMSFLGALNYASTWLWYLMGKSLNYEDRGLWSILCLFSSIDS